MDENDAEKMPETEKTLENPVADLPEAVYHDKYLHEIEEKRHESLRLQTTWMMMALRTLETPQIWQKISKTTLIY